MTSITISALNACQCSEQNNIQVTSEIESLDVENNPLELLMSQYRETVLNSIVTTFGLDKLLFVDIDGGNVQTMHNARNAIYANEIFRERGERRYNRDDYATANYMNSVRKKDFQNNKTIIDGYTGNSLPKDGRAHLEHIVSAKENHDNVEMRILFSKEEMSGMINDKQNTMYTDSSLNQSKGDKPLSEWIKMKTKEGGKTNEERFGIDKTRAKSADKKARKFINEEVAREKFHHYASSMTHDSLIQGGSMAIRQALGVVFTEVSMTIFDEIPSAYQDCCDNFSVNIFFSKLAGIIEKSFCRIKNKLGSIWNAFQNGFLVGVLHSIVTTIINMFFSTSKNIVRILRQSMVSLTEAVRTLLFNNDKCSPGDRLLAATKIILTGSATALGVVAEQSLSKLLTTSGLSSIPHFGVVLVESLSSFAGILLTGLLSVTIVYFLDNSRLVKKIVAYIDYLLVDGIAKANDKWDEANHLLDNYIAELCEIDVESLQRRVAQLKGLAHSLEQGNTSEIYSYCRKAGIELQFSNSVEFDDFMQDSASVLTI